MASVDEPTVCSVLKNLGGKTFNDGLYRVLRADEVEEATEAGCLAFPELAQHITVFGYDWLGRQFAADAGRRSKGMPQVLMLGFGTGSALQIPVDPIAFHNDELVDYPDDALAKPFFLQWQAAARAKLKHYQCAGYKVPLFLGGAGDVDNLEVTDLSVYWHLCGQLRN
ncbi:T6SS immunity protein Tdi1 domain-containing protein [Blastopirellula retiformator]|uniref:T6SS immunity protein Tdi1 C-terminal domain-containing protein n=1 Tax=Blastopirellula retiformator TaxID=2527970 RepID=A0A5C5VA13_9BACT|nr:T6SS immunity protein Tdi1 domain-containing protein [Blastopirellula retiformator]TWT34793.1 hypothetical protein Enr8_22070 [Blastopirellula retiformator]TWT34797.1 hypothetical protein Enr8_22110 [Blastopirellula retiformator]